MPALRPLLHPRLTVALLAALVAGLPGTADAQSAATPDTARVRIVSIPGSLPEFWDRRLPVFLRLVEERIARLPSAAPVIAR